MKLLAKAHRAIAVGVELGHDLGVLLVAQVVRELAHEIAQLRRVDVACLGVRG
tara:strand:- start:118 stop:276 length:159 start_codon:yes stop_codon:yes gene_type:complete